MDRVASPALTGVRYTFIDPPDPLALVSEGTAVAPYTVQARVLVFAPADDVRQTFPPTMAVVDPLPDGRSVVRVAAWALLPLVDFVLRLPFDLEVLEPPELRATIGAIGRRLASRHP